MVHHPGKYAFRAIDPILHCLLFLLRVGQQSVVDYALPVTADSPPKAQLDFEMGYSRGKASFPSFGCGFIDAASLASRR